LPLIDLGDAPDADCRALYKDARVQTGTNARIARPGNDASQPRKPTEKADATATERGADAKSRATAPTEAARAPAAREETETKRPNVRDPKDEPAA
jgi:hypothetical protein